MSGEELVYTLKNNFYVGNYKGCINLKDAIESLADNSQHLLQCKFFLNRAYISLGKYDVVLNNHISNEKNDALIKATHLMAKLMKSLSHNTNNNNNNDMSSIIDEFQLLCRNNSNIDGEEGIKIILATVYITQNNLEEAYNVLKHSTDLESYFIRVCLLLSINRSDIAEQYVNSMRIANDYSPLTLITKCFQYLNSGTHFLDVVNYTQDILSKYEPTGMLLNLKACAHIHLKQFDQAESCLKQAIKLEPHNQNILFNLAKLSQRLSKSQMSAIGINADECSILKKDMERVSALFDLANGTY